MKEGCGLKDASDEDILRGVQAMLAWVNDVDCALTPSQTKFAYLIEQEARNLVVNPPSDLPIADFIGMSIYQMRIALD